VQAFESVSTWRQPAPPPASRTRAAVIGAVARRIAQLSPGRLRVAVDGLTGACKTSFGHELAAALRALGRPAMRASLDDFKYPWCHAREYGYDRVSGEGYYRNAYDFGSARDLLLSPAGPGGSGRVALCGHDPLTGEDHRDTKVSAPPDAILIVDSVFAFRPQYNDCWDRIWLEADPGVALRRGITATSLPKASRKQSACTAAVTAWPKECISPRSSRVPWPTSSSTTPTLSTHAS
jgi:uridine kinase